MSIQAVAWALEQDLPARPKLVLVSVANHANHTDGYCWLKAETIAKESACTPRSVYRFIGGLVRNGYIRKAPRKSADGKQRANDYWILFDRVETEWSWDSAAEDDIPEESAADDGETQDVVEPHEQISHGATIEPDDSSVARPPVETPSVSCGPTDNRVSRYMDEPSKTNPSKEEDAGARTFDRFRPRSYQPPPPQPMGSIIADREAKQIFVYEGTPAYEAWCVVMAQRNGLRRWHLTTTAVVEGKGRTGWWFPSLFPPTAQASGSDPPNAQAQAP